MTQYIGWTTTPEPLNLKAGLLYMTQYIWSYSSAAQSKLLPANVTFSKAGINQLHFTDIIKLIRLLTYEEY